MSLLGAAALGMLGGLHAASWGAYKDATFEGFRWRSLLRSVVLGALVATAVALFTPDETRYAPVVLVGLFYAIERLTTEAWKTFLREDDQGVYTIPMRLARHGRPVESRTRRYAVGTGLVAGLALACWGFSVVQSTVFLPGWAAVLVGGLGGWLTACGGAWKDAPVEGFSRLKFLRSPLVATAWAVPVSSLVENWVVLAFACGGLSVATLETYKTFLTGDRPPGKWATRRPRFEVRRLRHCWAVTFSALWLALGVLLVVRLTAGLPSGTEPVTAWTHPALLACAAVGAALAVLVLAGHLRTSAAAVSGRGGLSPRAPSRRRPAPGRTGGFARAGR